MTGKIRIGTSNGHMPGNKSTFPPEYRNSTRLHYYSSIFNSIEVNGTFYKTPLRSTFEKWAAEVPDDFRFTIKFTKEISHSKALRYDPATIVHFMDAASGLGIKKGSLLIQFPGKIDLEYFIHVEEILEQLRTNNTLQDWRTAIEFRNESWYISETTEMLKEYDVAMVMHDYRKAKVLSDTGTANFTYVRFHGPAGNYRDSYDENTLDEKAEMISAMLHAGKDVYAYFNNTMGGAFGNAMYLKEKILLHSS
jgi:uncharacterized protein YecE (DUF72 family)